jgi:pimeloyl-ACP methyl ester carboxylesterase
MLAMELRRIGPNAFHGPWELEVIHRWIDLLTVSLVAIIETQRHPSTSAAMSFRTNYSSPWNRLLATLLVLALAGSLATALAPGWVRLALMQPARDLLFFNREIQPLDHWARIDRATPRPDRTEVLTAGDEPGRELDLVLDAWIPDIVPAPAVLLLHGSSPRGRKLGFNMLLAESLKQAGWLVLTPDSRGFGGTGHPADINDPAAWTVTGDLARLIAHSRTHTEGNGVVVAVGHSMGASQLLQLDEAASELAALALIGPSRFLGDYSTAWRQRVRFSTDRKIARALPAEVIVESSRQGDPMRAAARPPDYLRNLPVLLMDGEREGPDLVAVLGEVADLLGPNARHVTIPGSHHYCSSYQLPWPFTNVYVRREIFGRCFGALEAFLRDSTRR